MAVKSAVIIRMKLRAGRGKGGWNYVSFEMLTIHFANEKGFYFSSFHICSRSQAKMAGLTDFSPLTIKTYTLLQITTICVNPNPCPHPPKNNQYNNQYMCSVCHVHGTKKVNLSHCALVRCPNQWRARSDYDQ